MRVINDFSARVRVWCAGIVLLLGALTLVGWGFGVSDLASVRHAYIPMAPSTALAFICIGAGLLFARSSRYWLPRAFTAFAFAEAVTKLSETLLNSHFGIDELLVKNPAAFGAVHSGRMSPIVAVILLLLATGIWFATVRRLRLLAGPIAVLAGFVGVVVLLGYADGTPLLYGGDIVPVALTTGMAIMASAVGLLNAAGPQAWPARLFVEDSTRALLLRSFLPMVIVLTLVNGWVRTIFFSHGAAINPAISSSIAAIFFAALVIWIISRVSNRVGSRIDAAETERNRAQDALEKLNGRLEHLVLERTRELHDKNLQMTEELKMARELQLALLPQKFPMIPADAAASDSAVRFLSYYFPTGAVSGDFFTVFPVDKTSVGIFICDVMGHGVRAALVTSMIRAMIEECGPQAVDPGALLTRINQQLVDILKQSDTTMYTTGCYVVIDIAHCTVSYATAGHPKPILINGDRQSVAPLPGAGVAGPALGIFPGTYYGMNTCSIEEGDIIMLFTDGLFEVQNREGNMFDEQLLLAAVRRHIALPSAKLFDSVIDDIRGFSGKKEFDDDVCLVGVEVQKLPAHC